MKKAIVSIICVVIFMGAVGAFLAGRSAEPIIENRQAAYGYTDVERPAKVDESYAGFLGVYIE